MTGRPTVIVIGSGYHLYREYLLAAIAGRADVWLLLDRPPTWERQYLTGSSLVDTLDTAAVLAAGREVACRLQVDGVICWDELRMIIAAELSGELGLPGPTVESVQTCRDKHATRRALAREGVAQPVSKAVTGLAEARLVAAELGYPVVVKPRALGASIGVSRADNAEQLDAAYDHAQHAWEDGVPPNPSVLIEECVTGQEISIDCAVVDGEVLPQFLARKLVGFEPHCEEVGHVVDAADPLLSSPELLDLLQRAHSAVGYRSGVTHTEIMLTADGPRVIEINSRLGGDLIPYVASVAAGLDPGSLVVDVALGRRPASRIDREQVARIDFLYPATDVVVDEVTVRQQDLPGVHKIAALASPGQVLDLPPVGHVACRYGYVVTVGESAADCATYRDSALPLIRLKTRERVSIAS